MYSNPQPRKKSYKATISHGISFDKDTLVDLASDGKEKMYSDGVKIGNWLEDRKKTVHKNWYCDQNVDLSTRDVTPSSHCDYKKHKCVGYGTKNWSFDDKNCFKSTQLLLMYREKFIQARIFFSNIMGINTRYFTTKFLTRLSIE